MWVRAMDLYAKVFKTVEPKRQKLSQAQSELDSVMSVLKEKQDKLAGVEAKVCYVFFSLPQLKDEYISCMILTRFLQDSCKKHTFCLLAEFFLAEDY